MKTIYDEIREIKESDLPLAIKLCALWGLQNSKREEYVATGAFREVLREAMPIDEPMRVSEIKAKFNLPLSVQKLTAELYQMQYVGGIRREEIPTGKKITIKVCHWGWKNGNEWGCWEEEEEILETFPYYTRIR